MNIARPVCRSSNSRSFIRSVKKHEFSHCETTGQEVAKEVALIAAMREIKIQK